MEGRWPTQFDVDRPRVQHENNEPEVTEQSHKESTMINNIIRRYETTGIVTHLNKVQGRYADVSELGDYHDVMNVVTAAQQDFLQLTSAQRRVFDNDVTKFLDAAHDPDKRDLLEAAGLIEQAPATPEPVLETTPEPPAQE